MKYPFWKYSSRKVSGVVKTLLASAALAILAVSCGGNGKTNSDFPAEFNSMSDAQRVRWMMDKVSPDSVARFICNAALGKVEGVRIDTLANATLYAYEHYQDEKLQTFSSAYDEFAEQLPLDEKMTLRKLAALEDPMGLGYELGLEYVNMIRIDCKKSAEVESEIQALKRACDKNPEDSLTYKRFIKGFQVALEYDGGSGVPKDIYDKYSKL